jgi:hypothetical protein
MIDTMTKNQGFKLLALPSEVMKLLFQYLFDARVILFRDQRPASATEWPVQILAMSRRCYQEGLAMLAEAMPETKAIYEGCYPVRRKGTNIQLQSLGRYDRASTFFLRKYVPIIRFLEIRGFPDGDIELSRLTDLRVLTIPTTLTARMRHSQPMEGGGFSRLAEERYQPRQHR